MEEEKVKEIVRTHNWIKEGGEVCHKDVPERKMYVDRILKKTVLELSGDYYDSDSDGHKKGEAMKEEKVRVIGVQVHWFDGDSRLNTYKFHTRELVPYEVGIRGQEAIDKFLE